MKKLKNNEGFSLVEILIGLAILVIALLAITNLVGVGIKTNKKAEVKQQGLILGQQILEEINAISSDDKTTGYITKDEIKLLSDITLKKDNELSDESKLVYETKDFNNNDLIKDDKGNEYNIQITLTKNNSKSYEEGNLNNNDEKKINPNLTLELKTVENADGNYTISIYEGEKQRAIGIDPTKFYLKIKPEGDDNDLYLSNSIDSDGDKITTFTEENVMLKLMKDYTQDEDITINVSNSLNKKINFYIMKSYQCNCNVEIENNKGLINVIKYLRDNNETKDITIGDFYEIEVKVFKARKDEKTGEIINIKELFDGYANKNLKIRKED